MMRPRATAGLFLVALLTGAAENARAADKMVATRYAKTLPMASDGTLVLRNLYGSITVIGTDQPVMEVTLVERVVASDDAGLEEGSRDTVVMMGGDAKQRVVETRVGGTPFARRWRSSTDFVIRIPRGAKLEITSHSAPTLLVSKFRGPVLVNNFVGRIALDDATGPARVETVNGSIVAVYHEQPAGDALLSSVNGEIEIRTPGAAGFKWLAETLQGDIFASGGVQARYAPRESGFAFTSDVNRRSSPVIHTISVTGRTWLVSGQVTRTATKSLSPANDRRQADVAGGNLETLRKTLREQLGRKSSATRFALSQERVDTNLDFKTSIGNVMVGIVNGSTNLETGGGEIMLGRVTGDCTALSLGGPISIGDVGGRIDARTSAGDVIVKAARKGGITSTEGGNIDIYYTGGALNAHSGGGNVTVRQSANAVRADTRSGDISITVDSRSGGHPIEARAEGGNVTLNLPSGMGFDLDALIITGAEGRNQLLIDQQGLTIVREIVENRTYIRASGKINGGGPTLTLRATDGDIAVRNRARKIDYAPR